MIRRSLAAARPGSLLDHAVRMLAVLAVISLVGGAARPRLDLNRWWIRGGGAGGWVDALIAAWGLALLVAWVRPRRIARTVAAWLAVGLGLRCLYDAAAYYQLLRDGWIASVLPVPLSLLVATALGAWAVRRLRGGDAASCACDRLGRAGRGGGRGLPAAHIATFGVTDYRRPADVAVVFGAAVRPDGSPSLALADRTRTACASTGMAS